MKDYDELEKSLPFKTTVGAYPDIRVNALYELPDDRRLIALKRLRAIVEKHVLYTIDNNTIGAKNLDCSWGLCSHSKDLWPDPQDYIWPHESTRVAPIRHGRCPMEVGDNEWSGCFWRCRVFQRKYATPTRKEALELIDKMIEVMEAEL